MTAQTVLRFLEYCKLAEGSPRAVGLGKADLKIEGRPYANSLITDMVVVWLAK